jgi:hypothetical protein
VTTGSVRPGQTLTTDQEIAALDDRRDELMAAVARARAMLARWTGVSAPEIAGDMPAIDLASGAAAGRAQPSPDMVLAEAGIARRGRRDAARAEKRPDWGVEVAYQRRDPGTATWCRRAFR